MPDTAITISAGSQFGPRRTRYVRIVNNYVSGGTHSTIDIECNQNQGDYPIEEVIIEGNHIANPAIGINVYGGTIKNLIIRGNTIVGANTHGISVNNTGSGIIENVIIEGNTIIGCSTTGIKLTSGRHIVVAGNILSENTEHGIYVYQQFEKLSILNNLCANNGEHGIYVQGASGNEVEYVLVNNNRCMNNGQNSTGDGIALLYVDHFTMQNNHCCDDQGTATQLYGIWLNQCDNGIVAGNYCAGNATSDNIYNTNHTGVRFGLNYDSIAAASVPANFAANEVIKITDADGTDHYIPAMAAAW